ncbi:MAG: MarR family transcriptional regulator [Candidatus Koribacter versatilis]|uniref:MarR family transcriptional regulator n=1 Tax=Candidatus Korobacter versatilis TaxID=658062 RepID=A0A932EQR1_9BACT|nr:MarR family transcriptional regulator [Candidatus Koribacter versatilis]
MAKRPKPQGDPFVGRVTLNPLVSALWEAHDHALAPLGLTAKQGAMMLSLKLGEATMAAELARTYSVDMSAVTRMLDRMEKKGLVRRERDTADRRKVRLRLTAAGEEKLQEAVPVGAAVANRAWGNVTMAERKVLHRIVSKVLRNLGQPVQQSRMG